MVLRFIVLLESERLILVSVVKKLLSVLLVFALVSFCSIGCSKKEQASSEGPIDVNICALKGPTAIGMTKFMSDVDNGTIKDNNYNFSITAAVDEVAPGLVQGTIDIAAIPANLSSVIYNNTDGGVEVLAINTLGMLYVVENGDTVSSVEDLRGKTIYASGKGSTPEFALNYILEANGIDPENDVNIEWKSEHAECLAALTSDENGIAMLPQPFVATAMNQDDSIRIAIDLNEQWDILQSDESTPSAMITGVVVARKEFIEAHPDAVNAFLSHYNDSVDFVNGNVEEAASIVASYEIFPENIALLAIPQCNIVYIDGQDMKSKLEGYLSVLFDANPESVGGSMPQDDFYYISSN